MNNSDDDQHFAQCSQITKDGNLKQNNPSERSSPLSLSLSHSNAVFIPSSSCQLRCVENQREGRVEETPFIHRTRMLIEVTTRRCSTEDSADRINQPNSLKTSCTHRGGGGGCLSHLPDKDEIPSKRDHRRRGSEVRGIAIERWNHFHIFEEAHISPSKSLCSPYLKDRSTRVEILQ